MLFQALLFIAAALQHASIETQTQENIRSQTIPVQYLHVALIMHPFTQKKKIWSSIRMKTINWITIIWESFIAIRRGRACRRVQLKHESEMLSGLWNGHFLMARLQCVWFNSHWKRQEPDWEHFAVGRILFAWYNGRTWCGRSVARI
jgi:hypothetical protein